MRYWDLPGFWALLSPDGGGGAGGTGGGAGGAGAGAGAGGDGGAGGGAGAGAGTGDGAGAGGDDAAEATNKAAAAARRAAEAEAKKAADKQAQELGYKDHADMLAQIKAEKDKNLSEAQREKARADQAEAARQSERARADKIAVDARITVLATTMGCDPDVAIAMIDRKEIKVDDAGTVTGAKEALEALKKAKPALFGEAGSGEGAGGSVKRGTGNQTPKGPADVAKEIAAERKAPVSNDPWATKS